jgi:hypothetical protein
MERCRSETIHNCFRAPALPLPLRILVAAIIHRPRCAAISSITQSEDSVTIRESVCPNFMRVPAEQAAIFAAMATRRIRTDGIVEVGHDKEGEKTSV